MAAPVWDPTAKQLVLTTTPNETAIITVTFTGVNVKRVKTDGGPTNPPTGRNISTCNPNPVPPGTPSSVNLDPANTYTITPAFLETSICPGGIGAAAMKAFDGPHSAPTVNETDIMRRFYDYDFVPPGFPAEGVHITMEVRDNAGGGGDDTKKPKKEKEKDLQP
jgi:hypothetical protein